MGSSPLCVWFFLRNQEELEEVKKSALALPHARSVLSLLCSEDLLERLRQFELPKQWVDKWRVS